MSAHEVRFSELYYTTDGWRFRLKAANGEIVATGESYEHKADARAAALGLAPDVEPVEIDG